MARNKTIIIATLAATAVILVGVAGFAIASPYMYQNNNNGSTCSGNMMGGQMMGGGMMGTNSHMGGYGGMQCPYHQNGYYNSTNMVAISNYSFQPQNLTVKVGTTVTWVNMDNVGHTVTSDTGQFTSTTLGHMQSFSYTFKTAGTYTYHCTPHPYMTATITVAA